MAVEHEVKLKALRFLTVFLVFYGLWFALVFTVRFDEIIVGAVACLVIAYLTSGIMVYGGVRDKFNPKRWFWAIAYTIYYWFYAEVKAHVDVIRRILSPSMPLKPGIVKVPYTLKSDCGIVCVANSITNTPGTVTVDVDRERGYLYVHWIDVKTTDPEEAKKHISQVFEKFAKRIFDD